MAVDLKYGKVTLENGNIGEDEPVVVFRARDKLLVEVLTIYYTLCLKEGSPKIHLDLIHEAQKKIMNWQDKNETKVPSSNNYKKEEK